MWVLKLFYLEPFSSGTTLSKIWCIIHKKNSHVPIHQTVETG